MDVQPLAIPDVKLLTPRRFGDHRGYFTTTYAADAMAAAGVADRFVQDNQSLSAERFTLRGLHFQAPPHAQAKLLRVVAGRVFDVAVDLRRNSPTFGGHVAARLDAATGTQIYLPAGFAHGFLTLEPDTVVAYKCSAGYAPDAEGGLAWNDPALQINWPLDGATPRLSGRDTAWPTLAAMRNPFA